MVSSHSLMSAGWFYILVLLCINRHSGTSFMDADSVPWGQDKLASFLIPSIRNIHVVCVGCILQFGPFRNLDTSEGCLCGDDAAQYNNVSSGWLS